MDCEGGVGGWDVGPLVRGGGGGTGFGVRRHKRDVRPVRHQTSKQHEGGCVAHVCCRWVCVL